MHLALDCGKADAVGPVGDSRAMMDALIRGIKVTCAEYLTPIGKGAVKHLGELGAFVGMKWQAATRADA